MYDFGPPEGARASSFETRNPARSGDVIGRYGAFDQDNVSKLMKVARDAQRNWAALPDTARLTTVATWVAALESKVEEIARAITLEQGKPLTGR